MSDEDFEKVYAIYEDAVKHRLQWEWLLYFTREVEAGIPPIEAAWSAAYEWDF